MHRARGDPVSGVKIEKFIGSGGASQWNEYLIAGGEMVGEHFTKTPVGGTPVTTETRYFVKDHLGSVAILTDESGAVTERLSYDAWGKRRHADGTDDPTGSITSETTRGFTGHEMVDAAQLINMNGRIYDPMIGRMLSADPYIHEILDTQDLNRFSYVRNRSLSFTDASGYGFFSKVFKFLDPYHYGVIKLKQQVLQRYPIVGQLESIAAGIVCGIYGGPAAGAGCASAVSAINTGVAGGSVQQVLIAGTVTFVSAYATGGTAGYLGDIGASAFAQAAGGIAAGALAGGVTESIQGGSFGHGAWLGAATAAIGFATPATGNVFADFTIRAALGGATSVLGGGKFANGALTAAFAYVASNAASDRQWEADLERRTRGQCAALTSCAPSNSADPILQDATFANKGVPVPPNLAKAGVTSLDIRDGNPRIGWLHILNGHAPNGINSAGKSIFHPSLISSGDFFSIFLTTTLPVGGAPMLQGGTLVVNVNLAGSQYGSYVGWDTQGNATTSYRAVFIPSSIPGRTAPGAYEILTAYPIP